MPPRDRNELMTCVVLPPAYDAALRRRLADIDKADSAVNCLIAQARAEGMVEGLETGTHGIPANHIERLYLLIEDAATARLLGLEALQ
ncbi:hypothetical protein [Pseudomonas monteilii]|uniref:hypothetical protein n=1 Tax=Pseudomonas monteilii TaxID=76759 RepID=UPI001FD0C74B|nr:hypothetical protein [Pseudomonas monteilii]MCJ7854592.1 hypothetical protein [Pseudomonas monteilii]